MPALIRRTSNSVTAHLISLQSLAVLKLKESNST
jgi:hypothetical protein